MMQKINRSTRSNCQEIEDQIAALEREYERLERILEEPDLPQSTRDRIARRMRDIIIEINELRDELEQCLNTITISGIEKTQCIQYFLFNGQGSGYASNNSIPLIANRPLILRVYVNYNIGAEPVPHYIEANVVVDRRRRNGSWKRIGTGRSINGPIRARRSEDIDRGDPNHTLNLRFDAAICSGYCRYTIEVFETDPDTDLATSDPLLVTREGQSRGKRLSQVIASSSNTKGVQASDVVYVDFQPAPILRIRGVLIHYIFGSYDLPAPPATDFLALIEYTTKTYPCARVEFGDFIETDFDGDLSLPKEEDGRCGPAWYDLLDHLECLSRDDQSKSIYVGLI